MKKSIFFYKELTPAEVGNTGTHEIYVRLPNNFDYKSFFYDSAIENGSVLEVNFSAQDITDGANSIVPLRFVYFHNSNGEKRIPSLGSLFQKHNVQAGDIVCLESRIEEGNTTYFIRFHKKGEIQVNPNSIYFSCINDEYNRRIERATIDLPLQQIFYGAPGTGKSHEVKKLTGELLENGKEVDLPNVFRTTFHPDTDYASFVGCYKPTMKPTSKEEKTLTGKDEEIVYEFVPQVFADAYIYAYNNPTTPTYLVIEEINRGNCAQIFGDLFQLLDRKNGVSEYKIKADKDLAKYLKEAKDENGKDVLTDKEGIKDGKLCLPANLHILATMNTSDQSLFPIDSAFKRRWEWRYVPIQKPDNENYKIDIAGTTYDWWAFLSRINQVIGNTTNAEDKKMGYFFVKAKNGIIDANQFVGKVLFFIWNDVFKNYGFDNEIFNKGGNEKFEFSKFFNANGDANTAEVNAFLQKLEATINIEGLPMKQTTNTPTIEQTDSEPAGAEA